MGKTRQKPDKKNGTRSGMKKGVKSGIKSGIRPEIKSEIITSIRSMDNTSSQINQPQRSTPSVPPIGGVNSNSPTLPKGALIIGGGISGIQAALDLADAGIMTYIVERSTSIGGRMAQLDKTFPTNDCAMCILSPKLVAAARHPYIKLFTNSEITKVTGSAGNFRVEVLKHPRYIDEDKCVGCGECATKCPTKVPNEFDLSLSLRKAIYIPFPQAVPMVYCIDDQNCLYLQKGKCGVCAKICKADAIDYDQKPEQVTLDIGSIIVATGFEQLDPSGIKELRYSLNKNVITGLEFERLLNASGPTSGKIIRPSDKLDPKRILFVQCVGSRDIHNAEEYCSRICCMYAIKEALIAKEHQSDITDLTILAMEIRAYGKGFEEYYQRAKSSGINFVKGRASEIFEDPVTGEVTVRAENVMTGDVEDLKTDLAVLSSAVIPSRSNVELAKILDIDLDEHGFFLERALPGTASESSKDGIFLSGCAQGPKDIPDSVASGSAAAALVEKYLVESRFEGIGGDSKTDLVDSVAPAPSTQPITEEFKVQPITLEPRIGVFVCHCGINIAGVLDVPALVEYAKGLPGVVFATDNLYTCSDDAQRYIQDMIKEYELSRVVVASCTPRTHEPIFKDTCARAGLNPYLFDMTNIRDQCSWVHMSEPEAATEKARDLIKMAVARVAVLEPLDAITLPIDQSVVVIGGGIAGMQCALDLANQGIKTSLIERSNALGGRLKDLYKIAFGETEPRKLIEQKTKALKASGVNIITGYEITDIQGYVGNFQISLDHTPALTATEPITQPKSRSIKNKENLQISKNKDQKTKELHAGAIVLAIGANLYEPKRGSEFGYGKYQNVMTNLDFEKVLAQNQNKKEKLSKNIVFIHCVGSREHHKINGNTSCSRYCCQTTLHQALEAVEAGASVTVLHRGIRAFSKYAEELYYKASMAGVKFIQYPDDFEHAPKITRNGKTIRAFDVSLGYELNIPTDFIVLAMAMIPNELETDKLQKWLKIPRSADGFFLELHPKLAPVETNTMGIYVCGCAQGPKDVIDTLTQASAAAAKAAALVSTNELTTDPVTASVNEALCWGCGTCEELCAFSAVHVVESIEGIKGTGKRVSSVNSALCKGCGVCASNCPSGAMTILHFTNDQIDSMIKAFSEVAN